MPVTHRLAIYDMDRTVTRRPTFTPFLLHAAMTRAPARLILLPLVAGAMAGFALGLIDRGRLKAINQALLVGSAIDAADMAALAERFAAITLRTNICPGARLQIAADKAAGYRLVLATASYRFYAQAIAAHMGFDDCIATDTQITATGGITGRIDGENCYGPAKRHMVEAWMHDQGIARADADIRFYSDHVSDAPMFAFADEAVAVNAHAPLRQLASRRGLTIVDW